MFLKKVVSSSRNSNKYSRTFPQDNCYNSVSGRKVLCVFSTSSYSIQLSFISDSLRPHGLSTPGFPVHHQLSEFAQTHVHRLGDAIQPSHPLLPTSPPTFNLSQHRVFSNKSVFASGGRSIRVSTSASVLPMNIQD